MTYATFINNPQYLLSLHDAESSQSSRMSTNRNRNYPIRVTAEGPRNVPINVMLVRRTGAEQKERLV